jgi:hypothetical protein
MCLWNKVIANQPHGCALESLPELMQVDSRESFSAVSSDHATTFSGLLEVKSKPKPEIDKIELKESAAIDNVVQNLNCHHV